MENNLTNPTPESLRIPGTPGRLWNNIRNPVREQLSDDNGEPRYAMGGGTILAARWDHRDSTDIDIVTDDPKGIVRKTAQTGKGLAEALNGTLGLQRSATHVRITTADGPVDITVQRPQPEGQEQAAIVDGRRETVLSTCQILCGKLRRTDDSPPRDAYDIITAAERDPANLKEALKTVPPAEIENTARLWKATNARLTIDGHRTISVRTGPPVNDIGIRAAAVLRTFAQEIRHERTAGADPMPDRSDPAGPGSKGQTTGRERGPGHTR